MRTNDATGDRFGPIARVFKFKSDAIANATDDVGVCQNAVVVRVGIEDDSTASGVACEDATRKTLRVGSGSRFVKTLRVGSGSRFGISVPYDCRVTFANVLLFHCLGFFMPSRPRLNYENAIYHVVTRGEAHRKLFHDASHYERFFRLKPETRTCP